MDFDQWTTRCPKCHAEGRLYVASCVLLAVNQRIYPNTRLHADGFILDPLNLYDDVKDQSTADEAVECRECGATFDLGRLMAYERHLTETSGEIGYCHAAETDPWKIRCAVIASRLEKEEAMSKNKRENE